MSQKQTAEIEGKNDFTDELSKKILKEIMQPWEKETVPPHTLINSRTDEVQKPGMTHRIRELHHRFVGKIIQIAKQ